MATTYQRINLDAIDLGDSVGISANGGSRTFGNTTIAWDPSDTTAAVKVTVTMGGSLIAMQTLTPDSNQMTYNAHSGEDDTKGQLNASFVAGGDGGQIQGSLEWKYQGSNGSYGGLVGAW